MVFNWNGCFIFVTFCWSLQVLRLVVASILGVLRGVQTRRCAVFVLLRGLTFETVHEVPKDQGQWEFLVRRGFRSTKEKWESVDLLRSGFGDRHQWWGTTSDSTSDSIPWDCVSDRHFRQDDRECRISWVVLPWTSPGLLASPELVIEGRGLCFLGARPSFCERRNGMLRWKSWRQPDWYEKGLE